jgi:hypothetical protein
MWRSSKSPKKKCKTASQQKMECLVCAEPSDPNLTQTCKFNHSICFNCLNSFVSSVAESGGQLRDCRGKIRCPGLQGDTLKRCTDPIPYETLQKLLTAPNFLQLTQKLVQLLTIVLDESGDDQRKNLDISGYGPRDLMNHVFDLLNLRCPRCHELQDTAPDGCRAIRCLTCGQHFCWLCFTEAPDSEAIHVHVARAHGDVWCRQSMVDMAHRSYRLGRVANFISQLPDATQQKLVEDCARVFADVSLPLTLAEWLPWSQWDTVAGEASAEEEGVVQARRIQLGKQVLRALESHNVTAAMQLLASVQPAEIELEVQEPEYGFTPLLLAAFHNFMDVAGTLLLLGANVNAIISTGRTALCIAAERGHTDLCTLLVERGANVNLCDQAGYTPLLQASVNGKDDVIRLLLAVDGINAEAAITLNGRTPLYAACEAGHLAAARTLLRFGVRHDAESKVIC